MAWVLESDEGLSCFASDDDRDAMEIAVGVLEDSLNTSGHGCREGPWPQWLDAIFDGGHIE